MTLATCPRPCGGQLAFRDSDASWCCLQCGYVDVVVPTWLTLPPAKPDETTAEPEPVVKTVRRLRPEASHKFAKEGDIHITGEQIRMHMRRGRKR